MFALAMLLGGVAAGQPSTADVFPLGIEKFAEVVVPLENWLGKRLVIFDDASQNFPPTRYPWVFLAYFCSSNAEEATITPAAIYISLTQIRGFDAAPRLADFLSHAAAHGKLNHPFRWWILPQLRILSPHIPEKYIPKLSDVRIQFEADAVRAAVEFRTSANCTEQSCALFERLLAIAKQ